MNINRRHWVLGIALAVTLVLAAYLRTHENDVDHNVVSANIGDSRLKVSKRNADRAENAANVKLDFLQQKPVSLEIGRDIFLVRRKTPEPVVNKAEVKPAIPPPPAMLPVPSPVVPKPTAPALPFVYIGKLGDEGRYTVFLSMKGRNFVVKAGDVLAQTYRIDEIEPPMMTLTYLPLSIKQTMSIGEAN